MRRLYWDFFGTRASGTAAHFLVHLDGFIDEMKIEACKTGLSDYTPAHSAAWCDAPEEACELIVTRLRPHRAERHPTP